MSVQESLKQGDLGETLKQLQDTVRDNPSDSAARIFLFQLLAVMGNRDRALTQLNVAAELDSEALLMAQTCRPLLQCEAYRQQVFEGDRAPLVFGQPEEWVALLIQTLPLVADDSGERGEAAWSLTEKAFAAAPDCSGTINGTPFEWIADADMRLGPVIEAVVDGKYYWIPFHNIASLEISEPEDLRDLVWLPVEFTWANGGQSVGFIPPRYAGSESVENDQCALARYTYWTDHGAGFYTGIGQKTLTTDQGDFPLLEVRNITFNGSQTAPDEADAGSQDSVLADQTSG